MTTTAPARNGAFPHDARSAAALYLDRGLAPIPLPARAKDPGYPDWQNLRVTASDLADCFPTSEARNVGILNGSPSSLHVDVDLDAAEASRAAVFLLPRTGWIFGRPGSPYSHRIYRVDANLDTAAVTFKDVSGEMLLELRGTGGLTVFPPSIHRETGEAISWATFEQPGEVPLDDLRRSVAELAAAALIARHWPAQGGRDDAAMALTGGLCRAGWEEDRVSRFVSAVAVAAQDDEARMRAGKARGTAAKLAVGKPTVGWPRLAEMLGEQGEQAVRRVREWLGLSAKQTAPGPAQTKARAIRKPRTLPPFRPFPVDALPDPLREYVSHGAQALGCDPAYLALPCLSASASAIGNTRTIRLKRGWEEPCLFWTAIVGDSGTLKSPAYHASIGYLFRKQRQLIERHKKDSGEYTNAMQSWKDAKKAFKEGKGEDPGDEPEKPTLQRIVCVDTTIEKLAEILDDNPRGTLLARDELAGWLGSFTRYKSGGAGSDLPNWLEMFRAGTIMVDRKTGERRTLFIHRAAVSVTGGIQPGVLTRALTPEFLDAGLAARLLMAMPPRLPKVWSEREVPLSVEQAYQGTLDTLLTLDFDVRDGEKVPHVLRLSRDGKRTWIAFYNTWAREQSAVEGELAAAFSKLEGYAARFALLHHVVSRLSRKEDDTADVEAESVEAGIAFIKWCADEARRIYASLSESEEEHNSRRLVEHVRAKGGKITVRELIRANCRKYPDAETAEAALAGLVESGAALWSELPAKKKGKPVRVCTLCMTHDTHDTLDDYGNDDSGDEGDTEHDTVQDRRPQSEVGITANPDLSRKPTTVCDGQADLPPDNRVMRVMCHAGGDGTAAVGTHGETADVRVETSTRNSVMHDSYILVSSAEGLSAVLTALDESSTVALDTETTGLDPRSDRVRLLSLACDTIDGGTFTYVVDCFAVDPSPLWDVLAGKNIVAHNAAFDLSFLARLGFTPRGEVSDTMILSRVLYAGTRDRHGLADCVQRELAQELPKELQRSDWTGRLSDDQLAYAARDAAVLRPLLEALTSKAIEAKLLHTFALESRCLMGVLWMTTRGVGVDRDAWSALAGTAKEDGARLRQQMADLAPIRPGEMFSTWNFDSPAEVKKLFGALGHTIDSTDDDTLAGIDHPLAGLMRSYREAMKKTGTYGTAWLKYIASDGRVYASWNQTGSEAGRMSCSDPNMQQIPREKCYRRCVHAPAGRVLIKADYSQIELRIAAKVSGDKALLEAYQNNEDLHTRTARSVLGVQEVTKSDRQLAKSLNFGLIYGMGPRGLQAYAKSQYGVDLTEEQAKEYRTAFFRSYPGLTAWHAKVKRLKTPETRTLAGRRRMIPRADPAKPDEERRAFEAAMDRERLNTPVQGTGADGLKLALALLWERRDQMPGAFPVLAVHDEIVLEADAEKADITAAWLRKAMLEAMAPLIDPVPVEVEVKIAQTWGGD